MKNTSIVKPKKVIVKPAKRVLPMTEPKSTAESPKDIYKTVMDALTKSAPDKGKASRREMRDASSKVPQVSGYKLSCDGYGPSLFATAGDTVTFLSAVLKRSPDANVTIEPIYTLKST